MRLPKIDNVGDRTLTGELGVPGSRVISQKDLDEFKLVNIRYDYGYGAGSKLGFNYGKGGFNWGFYFFRGHQYRYNTFFDKYYDSGHTSNLFDSSGSSIAKDLVQSRGYIFAGGGYVKMEDFAKNYERHMPLSMRKTGIKFRWAIDENAMACQFHAADGAEAFVIDGQKSLLEGR